MSGVQYPYHELREKLKACEAELAELYKTFDANVQLRQEQAAFYEAQNARLKAALRDIVFWFFEEHTPCLSA